MLETAWGWEFVNAGLLTSCKMCKFWSCVPLFYNMELFQLYMMLIWYHAQPIWVGLMMFSWYLGAYTPLKVSGSISLNVIFGGLSRYKTMI